MSLGVDCNNKKKQSNGTFATYQLCSNSRLAKYKQTWLALLLLVLVIIFIAMSHIVPKIV
jgi:hypothetical protein